MSHLRELGDRMGMDGKKHDCMCLLVPYVSSMQICLTWGTFKGRFECTMGNDATSPSDMKVSMVSCISTPLVGATSENAGAESLAIATAPFHDSFSLHHQSSCASGIMVPSLSPLPPASFPCAL